MKSVVSSVIAAILGTAAGVAVGYLLAKKKYCDLADKEVASVKEALEAHYEKLVKLESTPIKPGPKRKPKPKTETPVIEPDCDDTTKQYVDYSSPYRTASPDHEQFGGKEMRNLRKNNSRDGLVLITEKDYNESEFRAETLFFFADNALTDDNYNLIADVKSVIGLNGYNAVMKRADDTVWVRDTVDKVDYEIIIDERSFSDIKRPRIASDDED